MKFLPVTVESMMTNLLSKVAYDEVNHKYIEDNRPNVGRFAHFKATFLGKLWIMSKANWLELLFCAPMIVVFIMFYVKNTYANVAINYSGNFGLGYPVITDAAEVGLARGFYLTMYRALIMIPCFVVAFVGLAGLFNVVKYEVWGTDVKVIKTFVRGVRNNFVPFMWMGLLVGLCYFLLELSLNVFDVYHLSVVFKIIAVIAVIIIFLVVLSVTMYMTTQASVYNLGFKSLLKNSLIFTVSFIPQNLIFIAFGLLPLLFFLLPSVLRIIGVVMAATLGISYLACVWTIYAQFVYDGLFANFKKKKGNKNKNKGSQGPAVKTVASAANVKKK
ncbi:MAG: hypothetical protein IJD07_02555 [Clostridia bacterium]|nr:hypothetical protein [Clostridia bacterium]